MNNEPELLTLQLNNYCHHGDLDNVILCLSRITDISQIDGEPFTNACFNQHLDVAQYLIDKGIKHDINYSLINCSRNGGLKSIQFLLGLGADIHSTNNYALASAAKNNHLHVVQYLIENGAQIEDDKHLTLKWARDEKNLEIIDYLLSQYPLIALNEFISNHILKDKLYKKSYEDIDAHIIQTYEKRILEEKLNLSLNNKNIRTKESIKQKI